MKPLKKSQLVYLVFKRAIDVFGSLLGIFLFLPLFLICWLLTKVSSEGPAIFKQNRAGYKAETFTIYKFRSMKAGAPNVGAEALTKEQQRSLTTSWGRFIRKTSLDEIPQLFNILRGDMSFIGPRPGLTKEGEPELFVARSSFVPSAYDVKPGLGGYAQILLKRSPDVNERAKYDSYYVQHLSFFFDVWVFILSFLTLFGYNRGRWMFFRPCLLWSNVENYFFFEKTVFSRFLLPKETIARSINRKADPLINVINHGFHSKGNFTPYVNTAKTIPQEKTAMHPTWKKSLK